MAKHKARKQDNFIRNSILVFIGISLVITAAILINNRHMNHAGTVDGQRVSAAELRFAYNMGFDPFNNPSIVLDNAWNALVELYLINARADQFGVSLSSADIEIARENAEILREQNMEFDVDIIEAWMGFTRSQFQSFNEALILNELVIEAVMGTAVIDEDALAEAFEVYLEMHGHEYMMPMIRLVEVDSEEAAFALFPNIDPAQVEVVNAVEANIGNENIQFALGMEVGEISDVMLLPFGTWGFFELVELEHIPPDPEIWKEQERDVLGFAHFQNYIALWREQADVSRNNRVFNRIAPNADDWVNPFEFDFGDFDIDWSE
ncbi:MAG: hypothetical protein FWB98_03590 [Defluviitaleaceae bacterium]|nr:hypothetical protein [Defluviitaleaceae bacterium]